MLLGGLGDCGFHKTAATAIPQFAASEAITNWNIESNFDFRLLPTSPALHIGTTTGIPNYDAAGRAYAENGPGSNLSLGALERNLYSQGWTTLTGAGLSPSVAPGNGDPGFSNCITPSSGLDAIRHARRAGTRFQSPSTPASLQPGQTASSERSRVLRNNCCGLEGGMRTMSAMRFMPSR